MIDFKKLDYICLDRFSHRSPEEGFNLLELVAWFEGEGMTMFPECVCDTLQHFALGLNDALPDKKRQKLMRFVPRLAGSSDEENANIRATYLITAVRSKMWPIAFRAKEQMDSGTSEPETMAPEAILTHSEFAKNTAHTVQSAIDGARAALSGARLGNRDFSEDTTVGLEAMERIWTAARDISAAAWLVTMGIDWERALPAARFALRVRARSGDFRGNKQAAAKIEKQGIEWETALEAAELAEQRDSTKTDPMVFDVWEEILDQALDLGLQAGFSSDVVAKERELRSLLGIQ